MPGAGPQLLPTFHIVPTFTCTDDRKLWRNLRLCLVTVRYVQQASESFSRYSYNTRVPGSINSPLSTEINLNYHSRACIKSTQAVKGMSPLEWREGCEEEVAVDGTPDPPFRAHEAGKSPCLQESCRIRFQDIFLRTFLPVWSSFFAILPSRSGTKPKTENTLKPLPAALPPSAEAQHRVRVKTAKHAVFLYISACAVYICPVTTASVWVKLVRFDI
jgi:hypothetical protein